MQPKLEIINPLNRVINKPKLEIINPLNQIINRPKLEIINIPVIQNIDKEIDPNLKPINKINLKIINNTRHPECNGHNTRLCKNDCSYCYNKSFASSAKVSNWSIKNKLTPREVFLSSKQKYLFNCDKCFHEFDASLSNVKIGRWCSYCSSNNLCDNMECQICFNKSLASHEKVKYFSSKNNIDPRYLFLSSTTNKYWFNCDKCPHDFDIILSSIKRGNWCPYCANQKLCTNLNCKFCFYKSFASSDKARYWSVKNDKTPREVFMSANKKYWFKCDKCFHEFDASLCNVKAGCWCSYCFGDKLCNDINCNSCFEKSFASHEKAKCWSEKNDKCPRELSLNSQKKYLFKCDKCDHEFDATLSHINRERWCPYCFNPPLKLCSGNTCNHCFNNSFASYDTEKVKCWSERNKTNPRNVFKKARGKYWFKCETCSHEFESALYSVSIGAWCSICKNKTEKKLYKILSEKYNTIYQSRYDWCMNTETNKHFPFDYELLDYKIIIELDGDQHFRQVWNWKSPEESLKRDLYKMDKANENGYTVIRLYQEDVLKDKNNWLVKLIEAIKKYEIPTRIFISSENRYIKYLETNNISIDN
jgi:very-short-patch-repair endonuclease